MRKWGRGRMHYIETGQVYEGAFQNDLREGKGYLVLKDGRVYCGQFKQNLEDGVGEYISDKEMSKV